MAIKATGASRRSVIKALPQPQEALSAYPASAASCVVRANWRLAAAPATDIFRILADPGRHPDIDGSGMVRGIVSGAVISGAGDVFVMRMHASRLDDYEMSNHVVEYKPDQRLGWEPQAGRGHPRAGRFWGQRWGFELVPDGPDATIVTEIYDCSRALGHERAGIDHGNAWIESMTRTLERLDARATR